MLQTYQKLLIISSPQYSLIEFKQNGYTQIHEQDENCGVPIDFIFIDVADGSAADPVSKQESQGNTAKIQKNEIFVLIPAFRFLSVLT